MRSRIEAGLLLAMPASSDVNLSRAVVMVYSHDENGALGLVMNRPSPITVNELFESLAMTWRGDASAVLFAGGPVSVEGGWIVFDEPGTGIVMTNSAERLKEIGDKPPVKSRFLLGHIDWAGGQLADASRGAFYVMPDAAMLFDTPPEALWGRVRASGRPFERTFGSWVRQKLGLSPIPKATLVRRK